jgi:hypothetical protein
VRQPPPDDGLHPDNLPDLEKVSSGLIIRHFLLSEALVSPKTNQTLYTKSFDLHCLSMTTLPSKEHNDPDIESGQYLRWQL